MAQYSPVSLLESPYKSTQSPEVTVLPTNDEEQRQQRRSYAFSHHTKSSRPSHYEFREWLWELLAWILSILVIAGTVVLLVKINQAPVIELPLGVQMSTLLTVLAHATQSALLVPTQSCISQLKWTWFSESRRTIDFERYDQASRGPFGSLMIILGLSKIPRLVHLGALATISMLAIPFFFQQALEIRLKPVEDPKIPSYLTFATNYRQNASAVFLKDDLNDGSSYSEVRPDSLPSIRVANTHFQYLETNQYLVNAIVTSMLTTSESITENPAICPSGKCNFPPYTSLALCHSIEDITSQLVNQTFNGTSSQFSNWITLPGITVPTSETYLTFWTSTVWTYENYTRTAGLPADKSALSLAFQGSQMNDLAHIYIAYNDPCLTRDREMAQYPEAWRAYKAKIRLCLQTRSTTFNLSTRTTINQTFLDAPWERIVEEKEIETGLQTIELWSAHMDGFTDNYTIGVSSLSLIGEQISRSFNVSGSFLYQGDNYIHGGGDGAAAFVTDIMGTDPTKCHNSSGYGFEGFTRRVGHVTNGVTNAFLNANSSKTLTGTSLRTIQYYNVEFWLLAFPLALFALVTIFFFVTVLQTTRVPLWKASQLAVLYTMSRPEELATKRIMENRAEKTRSGFAGDSWCLKESQAHVE